MAYNFRAHRHICHDKCSAFGRGVEGRGLCIRDGMEKRERKKKKGEVTRKGFLVEWKE